jgi:hypothetical protein
MEDLEDNHYYYLLGHSLADGQGFTNCDGYLHTQYPIGYPFIVSLCVRLGMGIVGMNMLNGVFLYLSVMLLYWTLFRISKNVIITFVVSLLIAMNYFYSAFATMMLSDISSWFFGSICVLLFSFLIEEREFNRKSILILLGIAISAVITYFIRTASAINMLAIFCATALYIIIDLVKNRPISIKKVLNEHKLNITLLVAMAMFFFMGTMVWNNYKSQFEVTENTNYTFSGYMEVYGTNADGTPFDTKSISHWQNRLGENINAYTRLLSHTLYISHIDSVIPARSYDLAIGLIDRVAIYHLKDGLVLGVISLVFMAIGLVYYRKNKMALLLFFIIASVYGTLLIFNNLLYTSASRYIIGILPFMLLFLIAGITHSIRFILNKANSKSKLLSENNITIAVCIILFVFCYPHYSKALQISHNYATIEHSTPYSDIDFDNEYTPQFVNFLAACQYAKQNLPDSANYATRKQRIFSIFSEKYKNSFPFPDFNSTPEEVIEYFDKWKIQYILLDTWYSAAYHTIVPAIQQYPEKFNILQQIGGDIPNNINPTYIVQYNKNGFVETENK